MSLRTFSLCFLLGGTSACDIVRGLSEQETFTTDEPLTLRIVETESCPLPDGLDPKKVTILSYKVQVRAQRDERVPANYFYASLLTTDGSRYLAGYPGCSPTLHGAPLEKGGATEGFLNFPIPPSKTPEKIVYAPTLLGREATRIELPIRGQANDRENIQ